MERHILLQQHLQESNQSLMALDAYFGQETSVSHLNSSYGMR